MCCVQQMVSLAYEVQSYHFEKKKEVSSFSKSPVIGRLAREPSLYDIISYSYCYVGVMTGNSVSSQRQIKRVPKCNQAIKGAVQRKCI